jgi:hypothetical protein
VSLLSGNENEGQALPETRDRLLSYVSEAPAEFSDGLKEVRLFVSMEDVCCPKSLNMRAKRDLKPIR